MCLDFNRVTASVAGGDFENVDDMALISHLAEHVVTHVLRTTFIAVVIVLISLQSHHHLSVSGLLLPESYINGKYSFLSVTVTHFF